MSGRQTHLLDGDLLDDESGLSLGELCQVCGVSAEDVLELVQEGVVDPRGGSPGQWRFGLVSVRRVRCAVRLERDLGVNVAGAALALELLEELAHLRALLGRLEP